MTHYDNNITKQKKFLKECGHKYSYLNKLSRKKLYALYRKEERNK